MCHRQTFEVVAFMKYNISLEDLFSRVLLSASQSRFLSYLSEDITEHLRLCPSLLCSLVALEFLVSSPTLPQDVLDFCPLPLFDS